MKKVILIIFATALIFISTVATYAQAAFNTGEFGVYLGSYGRFQIYTPDTAGTIQIERLSILVGIGPNAVFDYQNDVEVEEPVTNVSNPMLSDHEIYGSFNNSYSFDPPDVFEQLNIYGWDGENYAILKFTITNRETSALTGTLVGLDIIPYLDGEYGYDTVTYDGTNKIVRSHRGGTNLGYKLLSHNLSSLYSFEWYADYYVDSSYWNWMNYGSLQNQYVSNTADGPVTITAQDPVVLDPNESIEVYYGVSIGATEADMISSMEAATQKYYSITSVESDHNSIPDGYVLEQNYPNPFNPSTEIKFGLPVSSNVSLRVFNSLGEEVALLVDEYLGAGTHTYRFDASELSSGIYFYTLATGNFTQTRKMILIK
jgi:hypothetical protein